MLPRNLCGSFFDLQKFFCYNKHYEKKVFVFGRPGRCFLNVYGMRTC